MIAGLAKALNGEYGAIQHLTDLKQLVPVLTEKIQAL